MPKEGRGPRQVAGYPPSERRGDRHHPAITSSASVTCGFEPRRHPIPDSFIPAIDKDVLGLTGHPIYLAKSYQVLCDQPDEHADYLAAGSSSPGANRGVVICSSFSRSR